MLKRYQSRILFAGILSLLVLNGARTAFAQEAQPTQKKQTPEHFVKIYRIKHQKAADLMNTIMEIAADPRISKGSQPSRFALDIDTNSLVVSGDESMQKLVGSLLQSLDVEQIQVAKNEPAARDVMIRIVWLVDEELVVGDGTAIPPDLIPTVEKLSTKFGLGKLVTAGQIIINQRVVDEQEFEGSGTALVQGTSEFQVQGKMKITSSNQAELDVHLHTGPVRIIEVGGSKQKAEESESPRKFKKPMCELQSKITVTIGNPVFFGMASLESKASLFVVQVLDANSVADETTRSEK